MILEYEINPFDGVNIHSGNLTVDVALFKRQLTLTIEDVKNKDLRLVWLFLPMDRALLVSTAVELGFEYHHADNTGLLLTFKLEHDAYVPGYATHYIGAGGVVIDDQNRILVIQEKFHKKKHYKLPGGTLDPGEHISTAVVREVLEETGIKTEFVSLNCFRHCHGYRYGKSDIYFVCRLKPLNSEINVDPNEISKAIWMNVYEYLSDPDTHIFNRKIVETSIKGKGLKLDVIPGYKSQETHELMF